MADNEELHDFTRSPPTAPLPAPTTVTSRSLRPRRHRGRSSAASSVVSSSSRSRSRSLAGSLQLSYPDDASDEEPPSAAREGPHGTNASAMDETSSNIREDMTREIGATTGMKRRRSASPAAASSKGKRRLMDTDGPDSIQDEVRVPSRDPYDEDLRRSSNATASGSGRQRTSPPIMPKATLTSEEPPETTSPRTVTSRDLSRDVSSGLTGEDELDGYTHANSAFQREHGELAYIYSALASPPSTSSALLDSSAPVAGPSRSTISTKARRHDADMSSGSTSTDGAPQTRPRPVDAVPIQEGEPLAAYACPICFSPPSYATITPCGHVLCGECLFTAVKTTIQRGAYTLPPTERMTARCPVCRASIPGWDGKGGGVIGLRPRAVFSL